MSKSKEHIDAQPPDARSGLEKAIEKSGTEEYVLRLYVTGMTPRSMKAVENVRKICEDHLKGRYQLEIIDIYQQPDLAREGQIVAAPTLVKKLPPPLRRFIGDMSKTEKILIGLDLQSKNHPEGADDDG